MSAPDSTRPWPGGAAPLAAHAVARIGYGAMQLAERRGQPEVSHDVAIAVLRRAVELGVNHIDTAEFYGAGTANRLIRDALHPYPDNLLLATKVGAEPDQKGGLVAAQLPAQLRAGVEANLRTLDVDSLGVVNLRRLDAGPGIVATGGQQVDLDSQLAELMALRDEGSIGGIGLSNVSLEQVRHALPAGIACVQNFYNLLDRRGEAILDLCREHGIAWVPFFPLGSGFPGAAKVVDAPAVVATAASLDATPAQVGIAWLLAHAAQLFVISGTSSVTHLAENVGAGDVHLTRQMTAELDALGAR